ncbi:MAG TPA: protoporphyrinogen oxidase [Terriglobales bacterium]|nr:protoporphyrinogen oxidase [Terriglobales bacterium]
MTRIAIVGAGIAGLSAAWELQRLGVRNCLLLEAKRHAGGCLASAANDGFLMERGADSFLSAKTSALELCRELGLEGELVPSAAPRTRILHGGRLLALPAGWRMIAPGELEPVMESELFTRSVKAEIRLRFPDLVAPAGEDEALGAYLRRRWGTEAGEAILATIAGPLLGGIYGGGADAAEKFLVPRSSLPPSRSGTSPFISLRSGMGSLIEALVARLQPDVLRLGAEVVAVERAGSGWRLRMASGEGIECRALIMALPAWRAAELLRGAHPRLARALALIRYSSAVSVNIGFNPAPALPAGSGFVVAERRALLAATFAHQKFPQRAPEGAGVVRMFYGDEQVEWPNWRLARQAGADARSVLGAPLWNAVKLRVDRWRRAMPQYTVGHAERMNVIADETRSIANLALAGNAYSGVGIPDCIASGRQAAQQAVRRAAGIET